MKDIDSCPSRKDPTGKERAVICKMGDRGSRYVLLRIDVQDDVPVVSSRSAQLACAAASAPSMGSGSQMCKDILQWVPSAAVNSMRRPRSLYLLAKLHFAASEVELTGERQ